MPDVLNFAAMLVDINTLIKPRLYIMDAVMAMEGNGPRSGRPRKLGLLLISTDPIALDAVACKLSDLYPAFVPTSAPGKNRGWELIILKNILVPAKKLKITSAVTSMSFASPSSRARGGRVSIFMKNRTSPRPVIIKSKGNHDGICVRNCPCTPKSGGLGRRRPDKSAGAELRPLYPLFLLPGALPPGRYLR